MDLCRALSEIFNVKKYCDVEITVKGQSRSLRVVSFETVYGFLLVFFIVILSLRCTIFEIFDLVTLKPELGMSLKVIVTDMYQSATTSYYRSIVTMCLSRTVSKVNCDFSRNSQNFPTPCILRPAEGVTLGIGYRCSGSKN